jgi:hypothetical protein
MNSAHFLHSFQKLFLWSLEFLLVPPVLAAIGICTVGVVVAYTQQQPLHRQRWRTWHWLIFTQLLFFPAMVAVGVFFPAPSGPYHSPGNATGERLLDALFYLSLATSALWCWRLKGMRWLATSLLVLQQIILSAAGLVAGMSVSGEWL